MKNNVYVVIMAGGQGTRLWPLSRKQLPKQLIPFHGSSTLLDLTVQRIESLVEPSHRWVITTQAYQSDIEQQLGANIGKVLAEPATRNTGPAILYTCLELYKHDPHASVIFLPADHFIEQHETFVHDLTTAIEFANQHNTITLLGLKPTHPATGYGYIEYAPNNNAEPKKIIQFHEKPDAPTAQNYIKHSNMLWNIGIFCGPVTTFINQYSTYAPELTRQVNEFLADKRTYENIDNISIDHAIMEKSDNIFVLPVDFSWSDVGNLETFLSLAHIPDAQSVISIESNNNKAYVVQTDTHHKKIVTLIGVHDMCIIDTPDALLIVHKDDVEKVKLLQKELVQRKLEEYL